MKFVWIIAWCIALVLCCGCSGPASEREVETWEGDSSTPVEPDENTGIAYGAPGEDATWAGGLYITHDPSGNEMVAFIDGRPAGPYDEDAILEGSYDWATWDQYEAWREANFGDEGDDDTTGYVDRGTTGGSATVTDSEDCRLDTSTGQVVCR